MNEKGIHRLWTSMANSPIGQIKLGRSPAVSESEKASEVHADVLRSGKACPYARKIDTAVSERSDGIVHLFGRPSSEGIVEVHESPVGKDGPIPPSLNPFGITPHNGFAGLLP